MSYNTQEFHKVKKDDFVDKNFLLVSLEESKAKKIAEVINNDTARKILEHLAKHDCTESELSRDLDIPISTVHYNLKQLQDAQLVTVEEFHYSQKGKEINHYSLANKYIIIAPKSENIKFIEALKKVIPVAVITAVIGAAMTIINFLTNTGSDSFTMANKAAAPLAAIAPAVSRGAISNASEAAQPAVQSAASQAVNIASSAASQAAGIVTTNAPEVGRPLMQSNFLALFLIGALAIIIIYFLYELVKKD